MIVRYLICIFLINSGVEDLFMYLGPLICIPWKKYMFSSSAHFLIGFFCVIVLLELLCIWGFILSMWIADILSHYIVSYLIFYLFIYLLCRNFCMLLSHLLIFRFCCFCFSFYIQKVNFPVQGKSFLPMFSSRSFAILGLTFKCIVYFEFI